MSESAILSAEGVGLGYEGHLVFEDLSLAIRSGEITTLIGANGCGKSTLLKGFGRLLCPSSGKVLLGDGIFVRWTPAKWQLKWRCCRRSR